MRYGFRYLLGLEDPPGPSAAMGTRIHSELELWLTKKVPPTSYPAKRLLPLLPLPTHPGMLVEHQFRILFPAGAARGYVDLLIPTPDLKRMPVGPWAKDVPIVIDHKSTSRIDLAKTPEELRVDPQALLYGTEARRYLAGLRGVPLKEIAVTDVCFQYTSTKVDRVKRVHLRQTLPILEDGLGPLLDTVGQMRAAAIRGKDRIQDLAHDLSACSAYGGCPYRSRCVPHQRAVVAGHDFNRAAAIDWTPSTPTEVNTVQADTLARLRQLSKQPGKANLKDPVADAAPADPAPKLSAGVTPEPGLPTPDTSGLAKPIPAGTSPVLPPDAAPNVSPNDPPAPAEAVAEVAKPKRGRPRKAPEAVVEPVEVIEATVEPVSDDLGAAEIDALLKRISEQALRQNRLLLAQATLQALFVVRQGQ